MFDSNTDRDWEVFARKDPYFSVVTHDKYRMSNLSEQSTKEFFNSGARYIDHVLSNIRAHIDPAFTIRQALDFGCGVGRLVIPLAQLTEEVTGVDVSDTMLSEAQKNCEARSIKNAVFVKSDDSLSSLSGSYDFIHSYIVFQHIPVKRGERIFQNLLARLGSRGVGVVHFNYAKQSAASTWVTRAKKCVPFARNIANLMHGRPCFGPEMQMNTYNLNKLFVTIQMSGIADCYTEFTRSGGELGIVIYFRKP